jgi:hypothetical protein
MGHHQNAKLTVEECSRFDIGSLRSDLKRVDYETSVRAMIEWRDPFGRLETVLGYEVGCTRSEGLIILIDPKQTWPFPASVRLNADYLIPITTTYPHIGGVRYWLRCPVEHDRKPCGRRVKKLYLPPGEQIFGCRQCYDLTYRSCQTHDKRLATLARDPDALDAVLNAAHSGPNAKRARLASLGIGALALQMREMQKGGE